MDKSIVLYNTFKLLYAISHDYNIDYNNLVKEYIGNSFTLEESFMKLCCICVEYTIDINNNTYTLYYDNSHYYLKIEHDRIIII
jgi:hypothetical protein